jgi:hypothetical protein
MRNAENDNGLRHNARTQRCRGVEVKISRHLVLCRSLRFSSALCVSVSPSLCVNPFSRSLLPPPLSFPASLFLCALALCRFRNPFPSMATKNRALLTRERGLYKALKQGVIELSRLRWQSRRSRACSARPHLYTPPPCPHGQSPHTRATHAPATEYTSHTPR